jgi:hypothetical protein
MGEDGPLACFDDLPLPQVVQPWECAQWWHTSEVLAEDPPSIDVARIKHDNVRAFEAR